MMKETHVIDATPSSRQEQESGGGAASTEDRRASSVDATPSSRPIPERGKDVSAASFISYFDPHQPIGRVQGGNLPHWRQEGAVYFVTWRTSDSMPAERVARWCDERNEWLDQHREPHTVSERAEYDRLFSERWEQWLDESHGECVLRRPELKVIVNAALQHSESVDYLLHEWVVMPNHVHVLLTPLKGIRLSKIIQAWKSISAHGINKRLGRNGEFWQKESFDHIVRNACDMERIRGYIRNQDVAEMKVDAATVDATPSSRQEQESGEGAASTEDRMPDSCGALHQQCKTGMHKE